MRVSTALSILLAAPPHHINLPDEKRSSPALSRIHSHHCGAARWTPPEPAAQHSDVPRSAADGSGHLGRFLAVVPCLLLGSATGAIACGAHSPGCSQALKAAKSSTHNERRPSPVCQSSPVQPSQRLLQDRSPTMLPCWPDGRFAMAHPIVPGLMRGVVKRRVRKSR